MEALRAAPPWLRRGGRRKGSRRRLAIYLAVQSSLLVGGLAVGGRVASGLYSLVFLGGTLTLTIALAIRRPRPLAAWWLVVASGWTLVAAGVAVTVAHGLQNDKFAVESDVALLLSAVPAAVLAIALAALAGSVARAGPVDGLDAAMVSLAGFLLLWTYVMAQAFTATPVSTAAVVVQPVGTLLLASFAARIVLGGGLRDPGRPS